MFRRTDRSPRVRSGSARLLRAALAALASLAAGGCLYSPANQSEVATKDTPIDFEGFAAANDAVDFFAAADPEGGFEEVHSLPTDAAGGFSGSAVLPVSRWRPLCASGGWETFVRAGTPAGSGALASFDDASITGIDGQDCVAEHLAEGDWLGAAFECVSPDSPVARIHALAGGMGPSTIEGDVLIDDPTDADALACVHTIDGSLTIDDGVVEEISLPSLVQVTGDLTIVYERPLGVVVSAERVHLPLLETVGGHVDLFSPNPPAQSQNIAMRFGMPSLTGVGGDLTVQIDSFNCGVHGLQALTDLPGSLVFDSCSADGSGGDFLPALATIGTDLDVTLGTSTQTSFFNGLVSVAGDATIRNGVWVTNGDGTGRLFTALATVGGTLHVMDVFIFAAPVARAFDVLASVGTLDWESSGTMEEIGGPAIAIGGLRLHDNGWLTDLATLMAPYTLAPDAPITITDNASLPECDAWTWVDGLAGHVGPVEISGNAACMRLRWPIEPVLELAPGLPMR